MANVNITEVRLLSVPLDRKYQHTIQFTDKDQQITYFKGLTKHVVSDCTYQREGSIIRYPKQYDEIISCNYVMYKNSYYSNKWFYAFITNMEYKNDEMTEISIETDAIQTWLFDYTVRPSFVEREHVNDDAVGLHTVPENLETGEFICDSKTVNSDLMGTSIVAGSTLSLNDYSTNNAEWWNSTREYKALFGDVYDGLYSGLSYFVMTPDNLQTTLKNLAYEGQDEGIYTIFMAPTNFLTLGTPGKFATPIKSGTMQVKPWSCATKPTSLNGYTPKNKKLLTSPYCYLLVDNGGGCAVPYHYEKFSNNDIEFQINSTICPGMSIRAIPKFYNGVNLNHSEGTNLAKYAQCSWTTDAYTSWLAKNGVNMAISTVATVAGVAAAIPTGGASLAASGAIATAVSGAAAVASNVATVAQHSQMPPQLHGNTNSGDVQTASQQITFTAYKMSIKKEYAEIIDKYFNAYGYKVNMLKVPNKNHRASYWYTKTIDANISGEIPQKDLQTIKDCYNNGITFWRAGKLVGDYNLSNDIV